MNFNVEKYISNFVQSQFPAFYNEEGENFILFMKAYYEWMEDSWGDDQDGYGGPIREARELFDYRDIDTTITRFLEYFQKKYLYGIPFNIIANKRFLLKHILDVYRSKGTIQGHKLLFKLIYNENVDVYLPGRDVLRVSDGKWIQPKFLEVTENIYLHELVGKDIYGVSSETVAVCESYVEEYVNGSKVNTLFISNMKPAGSSFLVGERIVPYEFRSRDDLWADYPVNIGALDRVEVYNSGTDFNIGDILKIAHKDPDTNEIISFGTEGLLKVVSLFRGFGSLNFNIISGGYGFSSNASIFLYKALDDVTGSGANFKIKTTDNRIVTYNTDVLVSYLDMPLDSLSFDLPANTSANLSSTLESALSFSNNVFGKIAQLTSVQAGNGYIKPANVFVRSTILSANLPGRIDYTTSETITNTFIVSIVANTTYVNNTASSIMLQGASSIYKVNDAVYYTVPSGNTAITGLTGNTTYFINTSNDSAITLSATSGGPLLTISAGTSNGEVHSLTSNTIWKSFFSNTSSINNSNYSILISNANTYFDVDDYVYYVVPTGNTQITGLNPNTFYYVKTSNSSAITLSSVANGSTIELSGNTGDPGQTHYILNNVQFAPFPKVLGNSVDVYANTSSINNSSFGIILDNSSNKFYANDWIYYEVPSGNTAFVGLSGNTVYYVKTANNTEITLSLTKGGSILPITTASAVAAETHNIRTTNFQRYFTNNDVMFVQTNSSTNSISLHVIKNVISNTEMDLYGYPNTFPTQNTSYGIAPAIFPAQFALTEPIMFRTDGTINGINENILALNSSGNNIVETVVAVDSGHAYVEGEEVQAYRYGILEIPTIVTGGLGYSNGDSLIFSGAGPTLISTARGSVLTNSNGTITSINTAIGAWSGGSGYNFVPDVSVRSSNGSGAFLTTRFIEFDTSNQIKGVLRKTGVGKNLGYWATTEGQLNNDKYIQDSYYYQDYSYEVQTALTLDKYKDIIYSTFHPSGAELFGKFELVTLSQSTIDLIYDQDSANTLSMEYLTCDITDPNVTMDNDQTIRVSEYIYEDKFNDLTIDNTLLNIECSNNSLTSDRISINVLD
jgi:hypothetical protein